MLSKKNPFLPNFFFLRMQNMWKQKYYSRLQKYSNPPGIDQIPINNKLLNKYTVLLSVFFYIAIFTE